MNLAMFFFPIGIPALSIQAPANTKAANDPLFNP